MRLSRLLQERESRRVDLPSVSSQSSSPSTSIIQSRRHVSSVLPEKTPQKPLALRWPLPDEEETGCSTIRINRAGVLRRSPEKKQICPRLRKTPPGATSAGNQSSEAYMDIMISAISRSGPRIIAVLDNSANDKIVDTRQHAFLSSTWAACSLPLLGSSSDQCRDQPQL